MADTSEQTIISTTCINSIAMSKPTNKYRKNTKQQQSVRFSAEASSFIPVPSLSDIPDEQWAKLWTTSEDQKRASIDAIRCVKHLRKARQQQDQQKKQQADENDHQNKNKYCTRGLEVMASRSIFEFHELRKRLVRDSVLVEQARQRRNGRRDVHKLAESSAEASTWARDRAYERAATDAAWVRQHVVRDYDTELQLQWQNVTSHMASTTMKRQQEAHDIVSNRKRVRCGQIELPATYTSYMHRPAKKQSALPTTTTNPSA